MKPLKGFTLPTVIDAKIGLADRLEETFRERVSEVLVSVIDEQPNSLDLTFRTARVARVGG